MAYKHGAYGIITDSKVERATQGDTVAAYIGTAPVNLVRGWADLDVVNVPIKVASMSDAQSKLGYAADWERFTLCEAFAQHFDNSVQNIGPVYVVNVLDPATHKASTKTTKSLTLANKRAEFESDDIILDSFAIADGVEGTDYTLDYNYAKGTVILTWIGSTVPTTVSVSYDTVDTSAVTSADIIGAQTAAGAYTGLAAFKLLYQYYGAVLNILAAPGWSDDPAVYSAMISTVTKLNGHWDGFVLADIPVESAKSVEATVTSHAATVTDANLVVSTVEVYNGSTKGTLTTDYTVSYTNNTLTVTLTSGGSLYSATKVTVKYKASVTTIADAIAWKNANGYVSERSKVCWPMVVDGSGRKLHLSAAAAATMLNVDIGNENVPFETPSNKPIMATAQYFGSGSANRGFDQDTANTLNEQGITTACFWAGRWVLWGAHTAAYTFNGTMDARAIFDVNMRMLMHITNGFQLDHGTEIDQPMTPQDRDSVLSAERERLDTLKGIGALIGDPVVEFVESENPTSDMVNGDFTWHINVTNTPPFKSATGRVTYTDDGFQSFFETA